MEALLAVSRVRSAAFTLLEMVVVVAIIALVARVVMLQASEARDAGYGAELRSTLERYAAVQEYRFVQRGEYGTLPQLEAAGEFAVPAQMQVERATTVGQRVVLQLRHDLSGESCLVDYSRSSERARRRVDCVGGPGDPGALPAVLADAADLPSPDTFALAVAPPVTVGAVALLSPSVSNPGNQVGQPGASRVQTFDVRNNSPVERSFVFVVRSSDGSVVPSPAAPAAVTVAAGATVPVGVEYRVAGGAVAGLSSILSLDVRDDSDARYAGTGSFRFTATAALLAPAVGGPADRDADPGVTFTAAFAVRNRSNVRRTFSLYALPPSDPAVQVVAVVGGGTVALAAYEKRVVSVTYRLDAGSAGGTFRDLGFRVFDVSNPVLASQASFRLTTAAVVVASTVTGPADRSEDPGATFTETWTVRNASNVARTLEVVAGGNADVVVVGSSGAGSRSVPAGGSVTVTVNYRVTVPSASGVVSVPNLTVTDAADPSLVGSGSFRVTTNALVGCMTAGAPDYDPNANVPGPCAAANAAPTVTLRASATAIEADNSVVFTAVGSDADGDPISYEIRHRLGAPYAGAVESRYYAAAGIDSVYAVVTDPSGATGVSNVVEVVVSSAPRVVGCMDPNASNYDPAATDPETCTYDVRVTVDLPTPRLVLHGEFWPFVSGDRNVLPNRGTWPDPPEYSITATAGPAEAITLEIGGVVCGSGVGSVTCTGVLPRTAPGLSEGGLWYMSYRASRGVDVVVGQHEYYNCQVLWDDPNTASVETAVSENAVYSAPYLAGVNANGTCADA